MKPWIIQYLPSSSKEIMGQFDSVRKLRNFLENYNLQKNKSKKKKAILIYGPSGTGKTSSVYAVVAELGLEVIEVNASDVRNKHKVHSIIGSASRQMSLFANGKVILVDEVDGLSGTKDRGGIQEIVSIIEKTGHPIVLTALDPYNQKFSKLRRRCEVIEFAELDYISIYERLKYICEKESIDFEEMALKSLARRAGGDMRAAINDLQTLAGDGSLYKDDLKELADREQTETIINALMKIFKTTDTSIALSALDNVNEDYDNVLLWLDENLPAEYKKPEDLARAYDKMSKANVYSRRIRRWQHWRFLVYIQALLTAGIATSKDEKYKEFVSYKPSNRILKIWMANQRNAKKKSIAEKLAGATHTSTRVAIKEMMFFRESFKKNPKLAAELDLTDDEVSWLKK